MVQRITSSSSSTPLWLDTDDGIPEGGIPTGPVPSPAKKRKHEEEISLPRKAATGLTPQMRRFQFESEDPTTELVRRLTEESSVGEAKAILKEVNNLSFKLRNDNKEKELVLYGKNAVFALCRLVYQMEKVDPEDQKLFESTLNFLVIFATKNQRAELFRSLNGELALEPLRKVANRYYLPVDQSELQFHSSEALLIHVLERAEAELTQNPDDITAQRVRDYAREQFASGRQLPTSLLFHTTPELDHVPSLLENGIQVRNGKKYPGAYVSDQIEPGFGPFSIMACGHSVAAKRSLIRMERRSNQERGSVWLGSKLPITPLRHAVVVSSTVTPNSRKRLRENLDERGFRETKMVDTPEMKRYCKLTRELSHMVPVPERTSARRLLAWNEQRE